VSEAELYECIRDTCRWSHLLLYHTRDSRGSHAGFPDLVIVTGTSVLFRELKSETGRVSAAQQNWLDALAGVGADADVWRPADLPRRVLQELGTRQRVMS
jgi:hypothetical protein